MLLNRAGANAGASQDMASQAYWWLYFPATDPAVFAIPVAAPALSLEKNELCVISSKERLTQCTMPEWGLAARITSHKYAGGMKGQGGVAQGVLRWEVCWSYMQVPGLWYVNICFAQLWLMGFSQVQMVRNPQLIKSGHLVCEGTGNNSISAQAYI